MATSKVLVPMIYLGDKSIIWRSLEHEKALRRPAGPRQHTVISESGCVLINVESIPTSLPLPFQGAVTTAASTGGPSTAARAAR